MAWVKVPPENHPIFYDALPKDSRVETVKMFGGVAARVNGHLFAGLFGRSTMLQLDERGRAEALALKGASLFDPMGDGRVRSDKVMLPERMMSDVSALRDWIARAFETAAKLPQKQTKAAPTSARKTKTAAPRKVNKKAAPSKTNKKAGASKTNKKPVASKANKTPVASKANKRPPAR